MSDRYAVVSALGKGRTGGVYKAVDENTGQTVALRRMFSVSGETSTTNWAGHFAELTTKLKDIKHPNLIEVYEGGFDEDGAFLVSEFVDGELLDEVITRGHLSDQEFYHMANGVLDAFSMLHSSGYYHGSLGGNSIIRQITADGSYHYKIIDLGMSALIPLVNPDKPELAWGDPALMAPELFEEQMPDSRSDVYMLGHLFYMSLAGGHPLAGIPKDDAYEKHLNHKFAPLSGYRSSVPIEIVDWLELLTQADPNKRPANATEVYEMLPDFAKELGRKPTVVPVPNKLTSAIPSTFGIETKINPYNRTSPFATSPVRTKSKPKQKSNAKALVFLTLGVCLIGVCILLASVSNRKPTEDPEIAEEKTNTENKAKKKTPVTSGGSTDPAPTDTATVIIKTSPTVTISANKPLSTDVPNKLLTLNPSSFKTFAYQDGSSKTHDLNNSKLSLRVFASTVPENIEDSGLSVTTPDSTFTSVSMHKLDAKDSEKSWQWLWKSVITDTTDLYVRVYFVGKNIKGELFVQRKQSKNDKTTIPLVMPGTRDVHFVDITLKDVKPGEMIGVNHRITGISKVGDGTGEFGPIMLLTDTDPIKFDAKQAADIEKKEIEYNTDGTVKLYIE